MPQLNLKYYLRIWLEFDLVGRWWNYSLLYNSIPVSSRKRCCNGGGELPVQNPVQFEEDTPGNWHNLRPDTCPINGIHFSLALNELRQLWQLREENGKLKRLVADLSLDRHMLQEIVRKKL
jgi:hypothetical protein